jgi:hypothetical protein
MDADEILRKVAAGELTPEQALPLLDASGAAPGPSTDADDEPPAWGTPDPPGTGSEVRETVTTVRVNASYRSVDVIGDPTVAQVAVTGQHAVRREGTVLTVVSQESPFGSNEPGERGSAGFSFTDLPRTLAWAKAWTDQRLVVRVNPELPIELDAAGASVTISGMEAGARLRLIAAAAKLERVRGPLDLDALSSSVKGFAAPNGRSRIACESSSVKLLLGAGSDVRIRARNRMGKVVLPDTVSKGGLVDPDVVEAVVGAGRGELSIDAVMSSVALTEDA